MVIAFGSVLILWNILPIKVLKKLSGKEYGIIQDKKNKKSKSYEK